MANNVQRAISRSQVARLLKPKSIAVVGVSERPGTAGRNCVATLDAMGYGGDIHLVGRNITELDGRPALSSVADLPDGIDLAVLAVPGTSVIDTVESLATKKLGGIMCFASGFAEMGGEGRVAQSRLAEISQRNDIAFAGPNCLGYTNYVDGVRITFSKARTAPPLSSDIKIDIVCQSGGMAGVLRTAAAAESIGISYSITTGNEAVISIEDYMPFLIENNQSRVIVMIAETIRWPERFLRHAAAARAKKKPIVLLHLSRSQQSREAAKSHTGALAGSYDVMETFLRSQDVVLVETLDELMDVTTVLAHYPAPPKGGVGIVTDSGAFKGFSLDYCDRLQLPIARISKKTRLALRAFLPEFVEVANPVDVTAQGIFNQTLYTKSVNALMQDPDVGSVFASVISSTDSALDRADHVARGKIDNGKPLLCAFMGGDQPLPPELKPGLAKQSVPFFRSPERGLRALARAMSYGNAIRKPKRKKSNLKIAAAKIPKNSSGLTEMKCKALLKAAGISVPKGALATTLTEARAIAAKIHYPVALKIQAAALTHKSDVGGVAINISSAKELAAAWKKMQASVRGALPNLKIDGVLVEKMAEKGVEILVGARRDPAWGPTLMIGLGGVFAEVLKDVRFFPADAHQSMIAEELMKLRGAELLGPFRGQAPRDIGAVVNAVMRVGALMIATPEIDEIEINPLIIFGEGKGVIAADALIITHAPN